ncbi:histidine kinase dimerization/phosphoacceptor domain -containing protein [Roseomonas sp. 18066]|uniref:histidine kinase dimerization/phosphoacceptor domain -containing protein n=1 Tax=Roseomonas sp. 18066 TaxID=2681412 RepID=UPI00135A3310|nr:histidine kinase dimerization/phosphoacceptor domain -containing protein [Roseomonas sp. 18066]
MSDSPAVLLPVQPTTSGAPDLTGCDREPIHIPGAIQPYGLLLVAEAASLTVIAGAGALEERLAPDWMGRKLGALLGQDLAALLGDVLPGPGGVLHGDPVQGRDDERFELHLHRLGGLILAELEPAAASPMSAAQTLVALNNAGLAFDRAADLQTLCDQAALVFRQITGFDRVMIYRFLDDGAGAVLAEARDPALSSFLNHRFPASDVPAQARRLYVRNLVRVIPDVGYAPAPLRPASQAMAELDMSDLVLRSVSPIHLQYMRNMGIAASASISIVQDGRLWGLVACHNRTPRGMTYEARAACSALVGGLARQIRAKEEAEDYRERLQMRGVEDSILSRLQVQGFSPAALSELAGELRQTIRADGFAVVNGHVVASAGQVPSDIALLSLAGWARRQAVGEPFRSHALSAALPEAAAYRQVASGMLAALPPGDSDILLLWFRAEKLEVINWAGNPHKEVPLDPAAILAPRASFAAWSETVQGQSEAWSLADLASARRLAAGIATGRQQEKLRRLNRELDAALADRETLLRQKDFLMKEVNHRVQNSLQLVSSYLGLQARDSGDERLADYVAEAQRRLAAVSLVHRRLYRDEHVETVDLGRYLEELCADLVASLGAEWQRQMRLDLAPMLISADRAISLGLVVTELLINASKHAYGGAAGPLSLSLEQHGGMARLVVADRGTGAFRQGKGFGSMMMRAMVEKLEGSIDYADGMPGLRVYVTLPAAG